MATAFEIVEGPFGRSVQAAAAELVRSSDMHVDSSRTHMARMRLCMAETEVRIAQSRAIVARTDRLMHALHRFVEF